VKVAALPTTSDEPVASMKKAPQRLRLEGFFATIKQEVSV